jgi:hypothetical protein
MFGMLTGGLPRITGDGVDLDALEDEVAAGSATRETLSAATDRLVAEVVGAQVDAGLEMITDGQVRWRDLAGAVLAGVPAGSPVAAAGASPAAGSLPAGSSATGSSPNDVAPTDPAAFLADAWRSTAALTDHPVAQAVPGPYSLGRRTGRGSAVARRKRTLVLADTLGAALAALAAAGCPVVVVEEPDAVHIGTNAGERRLFAEAQVRLLAPVPDLHAMLAISGGSAADAGAETIFSAPYHSHLFDLIAGPDDWVLVRAAPPERGIVCGALRAGPDATDGQAPVLVWAANYAASTGQRGLRRVGLANATALRNLTRDEALAAIRSLGRAASFAAMTPEDAIAAGLDRRTFGNLPSTQPARRTARRRARRPVE